MKKNNDIMNLPTETTEAAPTTIYTDVAFAKEASKRNKQIKTEFSKINKSMEKIAFNLFWFYENRAYEQLGYKSIEEFANREYGIKRASTYNYISIIDRFAERDSEGRVLESICPEFKDYQSSKLIALLPLDDEQLTDFNSGMSVREIKAKVKEVLSSDTEASTEESSDKESSAGESDVIDVEAKEVTRQSIISFSSIEEYIEYLDSMIDLIEKNLRSKAFKEDSNKKIEISIVW